MKYIELIVTAKIRLLQSIGNADPAEILAQQAKDPNWRDEIEGEFTAEVVAGGGEVIEFNVDDPRIIEV